MNVIISQAMATGLPIVATDHSGFPDQVVDGKSGAVAPEGDFAALAEKLLFLIERSDLWPALGRSGREHAEKNYDSKTLIARQLECYASVLSTAGERRSDIMRLWERRWTEAEQSAGAILQDRFTVEAYRRLSALVTRPHAAVLEAGCGTGRFSALLGRQFPRARVVGIDVSPTAIATARKVAEALGCGNTTFEQADVFALPFADGRFDLVFNEGILPLFSLESTHTYRDAIREMIRVTKPGGRVVVSVPNWSCFPHTLYKWVLPLTGRRYEYGYEKSFKRSELARLLSDHGLKDLEFTGFYPSYGFYRLAGRSRALGWLLRGLGRLTDSLDGPWLSRVFGFQIVAAGTK